MPGCCCCCCSRCWCCCSSSSIALNVHCTHMVCTDCVYVDSKMCMQLVILFFVCFCSFVHLLACWLIWSCYEALSAISLTCSNHFPLIDYFFSFCSFFTSSSFSSFFFWAFVLSLSRSHSFALIRSLACAPVWYLCVQKTYRFFAFFVLLILKIAFGRARFRSYFFFNFFYFISQFDHVSLLYFLCTLSCVYTVVVCRVFFRFFFFFFSFRCKLLSLDDLWYGSQAIKIQIKKNIVCTLVCTLGARIACIGNRVCIALFCILPAHFVVLNLEIIEYARTAICIRDMHYRTVFVCQAQERPERSWRKKEV